MLKPVSINPSIMSVLFVFLLVLALPYCISLESFIIDTPTCRIPDMDESNKTAVEYQKQYCPQTPKVVRLVKNNVTSRYSLEVDRTEALKLKMTDPSCCLQIITRIPKDDFNISFSECRDFTDTKKIPFNAEFIQISCEDAKNPNPKFNDIHFLVQAKTKVRKRFAKFTQFNDTRAPSVFIIGADSVGRINLRRYMPKVAEFLKENTFYDFKGFTKIGDNTYPNIMAAFAGIDIWNTTCDPTIVGGLDQCTIVWKDFKKFGYTTAYNEDYKSESTFNYLRKGFKDPPVDYYGKTGAKALTEKGICAGDRKIVEYVYSHGVDFAEFYKGHPYFGLFWTNTLSHNYIHDMVTLEDELLDALEKSKERGILEDAIVIVMGDHGFRFPPSLNTPSGWYDVRLPILYISLPTWFKDKYPEAAAAMEVNQERLTSPYDLHLTLKDILRRSGRLPKGKDTAVACPTCQSLFKEIPRNRTCDQCGIIGQWCTCEDKRFNMSTVLQVKIGSFVVDKINFRTIQLLRLQFLERDLCLELSLKNVTRISQIKDNQYLITLETTPGNGQFEASVEHNPKYGTFSLDSQISRQSWYRSHSFCVEELELKNFCECQAKHEEFIAQ